MPARIIPAVLLLLVALCAHAAGKGDLIAGTPTIVDGDTFDLDSDRIRTWGYDTPEQPWVRAIERRKCCTRQGKRWCPAKEAADALAECLKDTTITCRVQKVEKKWLRVRYVSECWRDDNKEDIAACMVRSGWGTDFTCYSGGYYLPLEAAPKFAKRGLWQCDDGPPTKRWGNKGEGVHCEAIYKPLGPPK